MNNEKTRLSAIDCLNVLKLYPRLPGDYIQYMSNVGYGGTKNGRMIYSAPVSPTEIYGRELERAGLVILGDDFSGRCFAYDLVGQRYGEVSPDGEWQPWALEAGIVDYTSGL